jgi:hypothetical protein
VVLDRLVAGVRAALGDDLVGAYQVGSFALGGGDGASDVDFLVVVERDPDARQEAALRELHAGLPDLPDPWAQHLEGSYAPRHEVRRLVRPARPWLYVDNGDRHLQRSVHDNTLTTRWVAREHGVVLAGPEPRELVDPVPADALRRDALDVLAGWDRALTRQPDRFAHAWPQQEHVLGLCRLLHRSTHGVVSTKSVAARWALTVLDERWHRLVRRAVDGRRAGWDRVRRPADADDVTATWAFHGHVMARLGLPRAARPRPAASP